MTVSKKDIVFVVVQFLLFGAYLLEFPVLNLYYPDQADVVTLILAGFGIGIVVLAGLQLNKNLSAFSTPPLNSKLVVTGLIRYVRPPIYSGILMTTFFHNLSEFGI